MREYDFNIRGNDYHVELQNFEDNIAWIEVNGTRFKVEVKQELKKTKTPVLVRKPIAPDTNTSKPAPTGGGLGAVKSPLPGTILSLKVSVGQEVKKGDVLMIMEAMKMENEIESDLDGKVTAIKVKENDSVLEGDVLIEIGG
jgi:biotin carboxyl carrier protein